MTTLPSWLQEPFGDLSEQLAVDRLPHALLLDSQPGWGGDLLADALACEMLKCTGPARELVHPDMLWVEPDGGAVKIEQVRALIEFAQATVQVGERKVVVISTAETMSIPAENALLKILEEPPSDSHLVLTTTNAPLLLPTIRSRCQRVQVPVADEATVRTWLDEQGCSAELVDSMLYEYSCAPFLILEAVEVNRLALRDRLATVWSKPHETLELVTDLQKEDFDDLLIRWQRLVARYAANRPDAKVVQFWDDLVAMRRAHDEVPSLVSRLQLERLLIKWSRIRTPTRSRT